MWKKLFFLGLVTVVLFTACGQKTDTIKTDNKQEIEEEQKQEDGKNSDAGALEISEVSQAKTPGQDMSSEFKKGTVSENGWESQWLGMRFTAPEGTRMASEETLDELMGISEELLAEDLSDAQIKYAELTSVREMMCYDESTKTNVIVSVDRLPLEMSEEVYAQQLALSLSSVSVMKYERAGEDEQTEIAGISYLKSGYRVETAGQSLHTDYYIRMIDDRVVSVVVTYGEGGEKMASSMVSSFETYF